LNALNTPSQVLVVVVPPLPQSPSSGHTSQ